MTRETKRWSYGTKYNLKWIQLGNEREKFKNEEGDQKSACPAELCSSSGLVYNCPLPLAQLSPLAGHFLSRIFKKWSVFHVAGVLKGSEVIKMG